MCMCVCVHVCLLVWVLLMLVNNSKELRDFEFVNATALGLQRCVLATNRYTKDAFSQPSRTKYFAPLPKTSQS